MFGLSGLHRWLVSENVIKFTANCPVLIQFNASQKYETTFYRKATRRTFPRHPHWQIKMRVSDVVHMWSKKERLCEFFIRLAQLHRFTGIWALCCVWVAEFMVTMCEQEKVNDLRHVVIRITETVWFPQSATVAKSHLKTAKPPNIYSNVALCVISEPAGHVVCRNTKGSF